MTADPRWGAAVSTRNRPDELIALVESIARQELRPAAIAIVDQSTPPLTDARRQIDGIAARAGFPVLWGAGGAGLSAGRNAAFQLLAGRADWAVTANDTSTLDPGFSTGLRAAAGLAPDAGCLVGTYAFEGSALREPGPAGHRLTGWELWTPIEPACVWHVGRLLAAGGFDERIGTGSPGSAQSGEGTDLLVRLARTAAVVAAPEILVQGRPHAHGLGPAARVAKDHAYAVGTGVVYRRHFAGRRAYPRLIWPVAQGLLHAVRGRDLTELRCGVARARGRVQGYLGPERVLRPRRDTNPSDRWRAG